MNEFKLINQSNYKQNKQNKKHEKGTTDDDVDRANGPRKTARVPEGAQTGAERSRLQEAPETAEEER